MTDPRTTPPPEIAPGSDPNEPIGSIALAAVVVPVVLVLLCAAVPGALATLCAAAAGAVISLLRLR